MFRMRKGLKLACLDGSPSVFAPLRRDKFARGIVLRCLFQNLRQELCLRRKHFRSQSHGFAGGLDGGKIDMRGEVLFPKVRQKVVAGVMAKISAERAARAIGRKQFVSSKTVINRHQFSMLQNAGRLAPPILRGGTGFDGVAVG